MPILRSHRRFGLLNIPIFLTLLLFILYLNARPSSPSRIYSWNKVRYRTMSRTLPAAHGTCPGLTSDKPALIVARITSETDDWLTSPSVNDKYHICAYTADAPVSTTPAPVLRVPMNRGHESIVYLTYIIDNYLSLPPHNVFIHGSRFSWHNDEPHYDNLLLLNALNLTSATSVGGYSNLRCDWSAGTCNPSNSEPQGSLATQTHAMLQSYDERAVSDSLIPGALAAIFGDSRLRGEEKKWTLERNDAVRAQCCAQFVVTRESIHLHSKEEYIALRQWLIDGAGTGLPAGSNSQRRSGVAPADDRIAGRILSYVWQILFLDTTHVEGISGNAEGTQFQSMSMDRMGVDIVALNALACPTAEECYCRLYDKCGLQGCSKSHCPRQYHVPKNYRLPEGFEERYGNVGKDWAEKTGKQEGDLMM
jgi:hypothetical protein